MFEDTAQIMRLRPSEQEGEGGSVFDGLTRALSEVRSHGMGGIAEQHASSVDEHAREASKVKDVVPEDVLRWVASLSSLIWSCPAPTIPIRIPPPGFFPSSA